MLDPADTDALFEIGETYMVGGDWESVIEWFTKLLEADPTNIHALADIGTANMNLGRVKEAEAIFYTVLEIEPENVQIHYNMGFFFAFRPDAPDLVEAARHWNEAVRLDPGFELAQVAGVHLDEFGNALVVLVEAGSSNDGPRIAESYNGKSSGAPLLHIEYVE